MTAQVNTNQEIAKITKLIFSICEDQESEKYKNQSIFQNPITHVAGAYQRTAPNSEKKNYKNLKPPI